jgi:beta-N-acetylhexosaminidase
MTRMRLGLALAATMLAAACTSSTAGDGTPATTGTHPTSPPATSSSGSGVPPTTPGTTATTGPATSPATSTSSPPPVDAAHAVFATMTEAQRVGQLFMIDCPSTFAADATVQAIQRYGVGSVILDGNSYLSIAQTRALTTSLENANPSAAKLFVATDQEGGLVQRLRGPGFSAIPSAVVQGQTAPATLRAQAAQWGAQLRSAGITVDLAPVLDVVPADSPGNPPIGDLDREYGSTASAVTSHGVAVAQGLADAHVDATVKHFPGLGFVSGNTDTTSGVTDDVVTRHGASLAPFAAAVDDGVPFVMISTAIYARIDPDRPAAFSPAVITQMLRGDLGFGGVVISDDLGNATQVSGYSLADRATAFIGAGGDIVLTVNTSQAGPMTAAVLARAAASPGFRAKVHAAALRVLEAKAARGLLS